MNASLIKKERLRGIVTIKKVFRTSVKYDRRGARLYCRSNGLTYNRVMFSLVKKYGNAVARNRVKRQGKEIYRCMKAELKLGFDLIFVFYPGDFSFSDRLLQLKTLLTLANIAGKPE